MHWAQPLFCDPSVSIRDWRSVEYQRSLSELVPAPHGQSWEKTASRNVKSLILVYRFPLERVPFTGPQYLLYEKMDTVAGKVVGDAFRDMEAFHDRGTICGTFWPFCLSLGLIGALKRGTNLCLVPNIVCFLPIIFVADLLATRLYLGLNIHSFIEVKCALFS